MSGKNERPRIVVRRSSGAHRGGGHHGGNWKIAYADFMTALMALFLVLWLLGSLSAGELEDVSEYFRTPLSVALAGGDRRSASNSAIPGGGDDPTHSLGERALTTPRAVNYHDRNRLARIGQALLDDIQNDERVRDMVTQLSISEVPDGLSIQIFDSRRRPMFEVGSDRLDPGVARLLAALVPTLKQSGNRLTLTGHTDDLAYASPASAYGNWELSTDRANAARRSLVAAGLPADRLIRVIGAADTASIDPDSPAAPANRRITILLLTHSAEQALLKADRMPSRAPERTKDEPLNVDRGLHQAQVRMASSDIPLSLSAR